jgi:hypothetical protein
LTIRQLFAEMGIDPDAPEPVDPIEREAQRAAKRNEGFRQICAVCGCTPEQLAAMPVADLIENVRRVVGEDAARSADPTFLTHYVRLFAESCAAKP